jgi:hypothetical protein
MNPAGWTVQRIWRASVRRLRHVAMKPLEWRLAIAKSRQESAFRSLRERFPDMYHSLTPFRKLQFLTPLWSSFNATLENTLLPKPDFGFLCDPVIASTMFVEVGGIWQREELTLLERYFGEDNLCRLLEEDYAGKPRLTNPRYGTSHNSIHHLYHVARFLETTQCDLQHIDTVIEWGGGYGNFAKLFARVKGAACTYIIIDSELFSCLQWLYLSAVLGEGAVHIVCGPEDCVQTGCINLVPLCFVERVDRKADLFVSTWALSESSVAAVDYCLDRQWFGSIHLLLAGQETSERVPCADKVRIIAAQANALVQPISFLPNNWYAFK